MSSRVVYILELALVAQLSAAAVAISSSFSFSNATITSPPVPQATGSCATNCTRDAAQIVQFYWSPLTVTATVTLETVVAVVNPNVNTTRYTTITNTEANLANYTKPSLVNAQNTKLATVSAWDYSLSKLTPSTVAFPTQVTQYNVHQDLWGTLSTTVDGTGTCLTASISTPATVLLPSSPPVPQGALAIVAPTVPPSNLATDPRGWTYVFAGFEDGRANCDREDILSPLFPSLGLFSCTFKGVCVAADAYAATALYLTHTTTSTEGGNAAQPDLATVGAAPAAPKAPAAQSANAAPSSPTTTEAFNFNGLSSALRVNNPPPTPAANPPAAIQPTAAVPAPANANGNANANPGSQPAAQAANPQQNAAPNSGSQPAAPAANPQQNANASPGSPPAAPAANSQQNAAANPGSQPAAQAASPQQNAAANPGSPPAAQAANPPQNAGSAPGAAPAAAGSNQSPQNAASPAGAANPGSPPAAQPANPQQNTGSSPSAANAGSGNSPSSQQAAAPVVAPPIVINSQTINPNQNAQYVIGSQTLAAGSGSITIGSGASAVAVALKTPGTGANQGGNAPAGNVLVVGSSSSTLPAAVPSPAPGSNAPPIIISGQTITANSNLQYIVGGQTLAAGSGSITVGSGASAVTVALKTPATGATSGGNAPAGNILVIGSSSSTLPVAAPSSAPGATPLPIVVGSVTVTPNAASQYIISGQTLTPGGSITLAPSAGSSGPGQVIALSTGTNSAGQLQTALVVGTSTSILPMASAAGPTLPPIVVGSITVTANAASQYIVSGQTLTPGGTITLSPSAGSSGPGQVIALTTGTNSAGQPQTALVVGTSTSILPSSTSSTLGIGGLINSGIGAGGASATGPGSASFTGGASSLRSSSGMNFWDTTGLLVVAAGLVGTMGVMITL